MKTRVLRNILIVVLALVLLNTWGRAVAGTGAVAAVLSVTSDPYATSTYEHDAALTFTLTGDRELVSAWVAITHIGMVEFTDCAGNTCTARHTLPQGSPEGEYYLVAVTAAGTDGTGETCYPHKPEIECPYEMDPRLSEPLFENWAVSIQPIITPTPDDDPNASGVRTVYLPQVEGSEWPQ